MKKAALAKSQEKVLLIVHTHPVSIVKWIPDQHAMHLIMHSALQYLVDC